MNLLPENDGPRRTLIDPMIPMINVALLLLVYFLLLATLERQAPFEVELPENSGALLTRDIVIYVAKTGEIAYEDLRGEEALQAIENLQNDAESHVTIYADRALSAPIIVNLVNQLNALGFSNIDLAVEGSDG